MTPPVEHTMTSLLALAPVLPVVVLEDAATAVPLARVLVSCGLPAVEVTLRTAAARDAIHAIATEVPEAIVGAGTVLDQDQARSAVAAGARFLVSPGTTPRVLGALRDSGVPFLPAVSTASEVMTLLEEGVTTMKFFPAEASGGRAYLRSLASPLPLARFCPSGGITAANAASYLALPNVACVGGSWMVPARALLAGDWRTVETLAREAAVLGAASERG